MFDEHLNRQVRLSYLTRGPQWAFAIARGDMDALREVMRMCSTFWNGAGSLILPVDDDGTVWSGLDDFLAVTPVDQVWLHRGLETKARDAVRRSHPQAQDLHPGFDRRERHPLDLLPTRTPEEPMPTLMVPRVSDPRLEMIALACWGWIPDAELSEWGRCFGILEVEQELALKSIVETQTGNIPTSPLGVSLVGMDVIQHANPHEFPYLVILGGSFDDLVTFWNFRSRSEVWMNGISTIGVPYEAILNPDLLGSVARWARPPGGVARTPELMVIGQGDVSEIDAALQAAGFDHQTDEPVSHSIGGDDPPRERPLYGYYKLQLGGSILRGTSGSTLAAIANGRTSISLQRHEPLMRGAARVLRLVVDRVPLPLPLTASLAPRITPDGIATRDGLMRQTLDIGETWELDLQLPTRAEALNCWATDHGFTTSLTQDGRYAEALLARFETLDSLDVFADEDRMTLLGELASESRLKLVQRLKRELAPDIGAASPEEVADAIAERLRDVGIFLELEAKDAATLGGDVGSKARALRALEPLVSAGLVQRGQSVRCPDCNHPTFVSLGDLAERLQCPACRSTYVLPVLVGAGQEPATQYRLDGLMARVMDQDTLPVLLALRTFRRRAHGDLFFAWPGIEFKQAEPAHAVDVDLLVVVGGVVSCCEVKTTASSLDEDQLHGLLALAKQLDARPALAALNGEFDPAHREAITELGGSIFEREQLLAA